MGNGIKGENEKSAYTGRNREPQLCMWNETRRESLHPCFAEERREGRECTHLSERKQNCPTRRDARRDETGNGEERRQGVGIRREGNGRDGGIVWTTLRLRDSRMATLALCGLYARTTLHARTHPYHSDSRARKSRLDSGQGHRTEARQRRLPLLSSLPLPP